MFEIRSPRNFLMEGKLKGGLYVFAPPQFLTNSKLNLIQTIVPTDPKQKTSYLASHPGDYPATSDQPYQTSSNVFQLWHNRLGHPAQPVVKIVMLNCNVPIKNKMHPSFCSACCLGKIYNLSFSSSTNKYPTTLQLIHTDLWVPSSVPSSNS